MATVSLPKSLPNADCTLEMALGRCAAQTAFTISSTREPDMPIIYVSSEFCKMTGYSRSEILGRNCRFMQGPGTSRQSVQEIRNCIQEDRGCTVCLMNYTKDGKPFWNQLCLAPIRDEFGVACYLGIQTNVTGAVLAFRSQHFSPFHTKTAGPHGGVHSFTCPEIVVKEMEDAKKLEGTIRRWHSEKLESITVAPTDFRPVSSKALPASLLAPLYKLQQSYVLADPNLPDMPIVHASEGFLRLTGRPRNQVVGHNCRFMQGPLTDGAELQRLRNAIKEEKPITVRLLNYKADGELFWNNLHVSPIRNADGKVVFFVGCQLDITVKQSTPESRHSDCTAGSCHVLNGIQGLSNTPNGKVTTKDVEDHSVANSSSAGPAKKGVTNTEGKQGQDSNDMPSSLASPGSVQVPEARRLLSPGAKQQQRSVIGAVRVVCRSLSTKTGLRRSLEDQHLPHGMDDCAGHQQPLTK